jgi:HPt (histidine-containing phosphotransfer) domain-containing protein
MLTTLFGRVKLDTLFDELKVELEHFVSSYTASPGLAKQAQRLASSASMLGFGNVTKYCSRFEEALSGYGQTPVTFDEVREVCLAALSEISARSSGGVGIPASTVVLG